MRVAPQTEALTANWYEDAAKPASPEARALRRRQCRTEDGRLPWGWMPA